MKTKLTSPVVRGGFAYGLSDGILECIDVSTGERVWKKGRYEHGQVLLAGNYLLVHAESGFLVAGEATPDGWTELARVTTIDGVCWNTICLYDDKILVRSDLEAACFQLPVRGSAAVVPPATDDEPGSAGDDSGERP